MMSRNVDLFKISRTLLQFIGETGSPVSKYVILFRLFNGVVLTFVAIFMFANFFHATGDIHVATAQSLISVIHTLLKYSLLIYFKSDIRKLLKGEFTMFWRHLDKKLIRRANTVRKLMELMQTCIIFASLAAISLYFFRPILNHTSPYLLETWASEYIPLDAILLASQYYFFCIVTSIVLGYDTIYLSLCVHVVLQVKILKHKMKRFSEVYSDEKKIGKYVACHQLLLSTFMQMKRIYSAMLLFHYFVTLITACSDLYEVLLRKDATSDIIAKVVSICVLFVQFAYYTFPAERVAFEFSNLSNSIYMSGWYKNTTTVQKHLLFMMLKCNQQQYFTGGGFINVNVDTFGSVVKKSFSFYAILRNVLTK